MLEKRYNNKIWIFEYFPSLKATNEVKRSVFCDIILFCSQTVNS